MKVWKRVSVFKQMILKGVSAEVVEQKHLRPFCLDSYLYVAFFMWKKACTMAICTQNKDLVLQPQLPGQSF